MKRISKKRRVTGRILASLLGIFLFLSALATIIGVEGVSEQYISLGLEDYRVTIGIGKIIIAFLIAFPLTFTVGVLANSAFWGGAIVAHMASDGNFIFQSVMLVLVWVAYFLIAGNPLKK